MPNRKILTLSRLMVAWQQALFLHLDSTNLGTQVVARHVYLELQKKLAPQMSLEVGAHRAEFSQDMRALFPEMEIVAFEASPVVYEYFKAREDYEGKNISYLNLAVSESDGFVSFKVLEENGGISGHNSLQPRPDLPGRRVRVPSICGDSFLRDRPQDNIALWIDVEGATERVLPGLRESLRAERFSSVFIEVEGIEMWKDQWLDHQVTAFFIGHGYLPVFCDAEHCPPAFAGMRQYNLVFMPESRLTEELVAWIVACYLDTAGRLRFVKKS